ncbi:MAG TPA: hypothetical protein VL220_10175 [Steroidobacteraceae bacterium]|jgi:hypothetical protein|nr:hypothetical protein [Steroidobacteraceae bacterium]
MRNEARYLAAALHGRAPVLALGLILAGAVQAGPLDDTFDLSLGAFILSTKTTVRADGSPAPGAPVEIGTPIDVERQLDISDRASFRLDGYWRFLERHKLRVMYFDENRSGDKTITDEIVFRGQTYPVNTRISTRFDTVVAELAYEYAFLKGEHYELAGSIGIHDLTFKLQLTAAGQNVNAQQSARADVDGPLPVLGVHYVWEFYPRWSLDAMFQFFALKYQQYDGNLQDYNATVYYMPWKNFGFGVGWNEFRTSVNVDNASYDGNLAWRYGGVRLFFKASY